MTAQQAYNTPTEVSVVDGEVTLNGPDGVGLSMTAKAARETAERLLRAAEEIENQVGPRA